jgi:hypothetical protein
MCQVGFLKHCAVAGAAVAAADVLFAAGALGDELSGFGSSTLGMRLVSLPPGTQRFSRCFVLEATASEKSCQLHPHCPRVLFAGRRFRVSSERPKAQ